MVTSCQHRLMWHVLFTAEGSLWPYEFEDAEEQRVRWIVYNTWSDPSGGDITAGNRRRTPLKADKM